MIAAVSNLQLIKDYVNIEWEIHVITNDRFYVI